MMPLVGAELPIGKELMGQLSNSKFASSQRGLNQTMIGFIDRGQPVPGTQALSIRTDIIT